MWVDCSANCGGTGTFLWPGRQAGGLHFFKKEDQFGLSTMGVSHCSASLESFCQAVEKRLNNVLTLVGILEESWELVHPVYM